jgi:hypothetical protein
MGHNSTDANRFLIPMEELPDRNFPPRPFLASHPYKKTGRVSPARVKKTCAQQTNPQHYRFSLLARASSQQVQPQPNGHKAAN